jgi:hypothetical protein
MGQAVGRKHPNATPTSFFSSLPVTFLFQGTSVSSTLSVLEIMEEGKYTEKEERIFILKLCSVYPKLIFQVR